MSVIDTRMPALCARANPSSAHSSAFPVRADRNVRPYNLDFVIIDNEHGRRASNDEHRSGGARVERRAGLLLARADICRCSMSASGIQVPGVDRRRKRRIVAAASTAVSVRCSVLDARGRLQFSAAIRTSRVERRHGGGDHGRDARGR
jgi:hypothetical protein